MLEIEDRVVPVSGVELKHICAIAAAQGIVAKLASDGVSAASPFEKIRAAATALKGA